MISKNRFPQHTVCSLAGRYDSPTSTRFPSYHRLNENECGSGFWSTTMVTRASETVQTTFIPGSGVKVSCRIGVIWYLLLIFTLITCFLIRLFFSSSKACGTEQWNKTKNARSTECGGDDSLVHEVNPESHVGCVNRYWLPVRVVHPYGTNFLLLSFWIRIRILLFSWVTFKMHPVTKSYESYEFLSFF